MKKLLAVLSALFLFVCAVVAQDPVTTAISADILGANNTTNKISPVKLGNILNALHNYDRAKIRDTTSVPSTGTQWMKNNFYRLTGTSYIYFYDQNGIRVDLQGALTLKTVNGNSLLGSGDLAISGISEDSISFNSALIAFKKIANDTTNNAISIAFVGDSRTENQYESFQAAKDLKTKFGFGGVGSWNLGSDAYPFPGVTVVKSGAATTKLSLTGDALKSINGLALQTQTGSIITINSSAALEYGVFDKIQIWYAQQGSAITYTVTIDGVAQSNMVTTTGSGIDSKIYNTTTGNHTIVITQTSAGTGVLLECNLTIAGSHGLVVHRIGKGGITAAQMATASANVSYIVPTITPSLVIIRLGANNLSDGGGSASAQNIRTIARNYQANGAKSILVLGETDNNTAGKAYVDSYNQAYQTLCDTANFAFCNLKNAAKNWDDFIAQGYSTLGDPVHPTGAGGTFLWRYIQRYLYDNTYSVNATANASSGWGLTGNSGTTAGTNFVGTTDSINLQLRANNNDIVALTANGSFLLRGNATTGIAPSEIGTRFFYIPAKSGALRSGIVSGDAWTNDSVGVSSMAIGSNPKAIGDYSFAQGFQPVARGHYSFSIGSQTHAVKNYSFAQGDRSVANGQWSSALGLQSVANGDYAFSQGNASIANGFASVAIGYQSSAQGSYAVSLGDRNTVGSYGFGVGSLGVSTGSYSVTMGRSSTTNANSYAIAGGYASSVIGDYGTAFGLNAIAGFGAFSAGWNTKSNSPYSATVGSATIANGTYSLAGGINTRTQGNGSFSYGDLNVAYGINSVAFGLDNRTKADGELVIGRFADSTSTAIAGSPLSTDRIFQIGNGTSTSARSNAVTILRDGKTGFGTISPVQAVDIAGNLQMKNAGNKIIIKEGSNASMGVATLVGGTVTISNTLVTANSRIFVTVQTASGTQGFLSVTRSAGTSFTITSSSALETSVIAWHIIEPAP